MLKRGMSQIVIITALLCKYFRLKHTRLTAVFVAFVLWTEVMRWFDFLLQYEIVLSVYWCLMAAIFPCVDSIPTRGLSLCPLVCLPRLHVNDSLRIPIRINFQIFKVASKTPSHVQIVQLFCKTGYFLALNVSSERNRVLGTVNQSSENSK